ncbi:hypothetical protein [Nocardioides sp.]|uniref:hypothetical protein n=1 Tax=Nocardioides sp. TaxID=35761 RepID=UPI0035139387
MASTRSAETLAQQLLDAQVAHHLARLTGEDAAAEVAAVVEELLSAAERHPIAEVVDAEALHDVVGRVLREVPPSAAVSGLVEMATELLLDGPATPHLLGDLADRDQVERLIDALLELHPLLEQRLDRLAAAPSVGVVASRFMGRIVGEVVEANKAVAGKVPGLGSLVNLGTGAATRLVGAADKQLDGLLGDTLGKGGGLAVRRLNRILLETLRDPATREALLQVWDLAAAGRVDGIQDPEARTRISGVVDAAHAVVLTATASEQATALGHAVVDAFLDRFGGYTAAELLEQLDLRREDLVADAVRLAPPVLAALHDSGDLDRILRARLAPFYASPEVAALLADG